MVVSLQVLTCAACNDNLRARVRDTLQDRRRRHRREQALSYRNTERQSITTHAHSGHFTSTGGLGRFDGILETTVSDQSTAQATLGYLLLRDGHSIPLHGISPRDIKAGAQHRVPNPDADPIKHRQCLTAIVDRLGFPGDFGTFQRHGWPDFRRFLDRKGCTHRAGLFPVNHGGCIDMYFGEHGGPRPRELADRIFNNPGSIPKRVFLGYGVNWRAWDGGNGIAAPFDAIASIGIDASTASRYARDLFARRHDLAGQWGFLDDKLIDGPVRTVVDKSYWPRTSHAEEREQNLKKVNAAVKAFRTVFDCQPNGWVDVYPYNDRLVVLHAHDGGWDVLWSNYREEQPPVAGQGGSVPELELQDMPLRLMSEGERRRSLYLRQDIWEEKEAHEAEQAFYDRGGSIVERRMTSSVEVLSAWLREQRKLAPPQFVARDSGLPPGFSIVTIGGRRVAVSGMITVGAFRSTLAGSAYGERRSEGNEPWGRANEGASDEMPVGASWIDAQAFCAWKEREIGVMLRLPTRGELREFRPIFSSHYERLAGSDFPWENFPPRPMSGTEGVESRHDLPSAVAWSEPRFLEPRQDLPEFPTHNGWSTTSRKRWIADFPPYAAWTRRLPLAKHNGLEFIDAWDAYEWCQEREWVSGRFWEGPIGADSWGAYKNVKTTFRLVMDLEE
jgi:hypothetical protein